MSLVEEPRGGAPLLGGDKTGARLQVCSRDFGQPNSSSHWINSSAPTSIDCGIVRPRALAVLRLMTDSNFVGCSTGRSAGLAPLRILSTYSAARRYISSGYGP